MERKSPTTITTHAMERYWERTGKGEGDIGDELVKQTVLKEMHDLLRQSDVSSGREGSSVLCYPSVKNPEWVFVRRGGRISTVLLGDDEGKHWQGKRPTLVERGYKRPDQREKDSWWEQALGVLDEIRGSNGGRV